MLFQMLGYPTYPTNDSFFFPWVGDKIVEWDQNGDIVWEWDTFDNLNWLADYDVIGGTWDDAYLQGRHDWTHSNALLFNESDSCSTADEVYTMLVLGFATSGSESLS